MYRTKSAFALAALATCCVSLAWPGAAHAAVIDDLEEQGALDHWEFSNGPEFPGARGSLSNVAGRVGRGARLAYDFSGGGTYVSMTRSLSNVEAGRSLSLWVRADVRMPMTLRLTDSTGQTVQYDLRRSLEAIATGAWSQLVLKPEAAPRDFWGGAKDGKLRGNLVSLGIVLPKPKQAPLTGHVDIDEIVTIEPTAAYAIDPEAAGYALSESSGDLFSRWGVTVHDMGDESALDALHQTGFTWVRTDLFWRYVEQERGVYDFEPYERSVAALERRDMKAVLILDYGNELYGGGPPRTPEAVRAFGAFARAAAEHFAGRSVLFEVWNEPDNAGFWPPGNRPLEYADLLREVISSVHAGDPRAQVTSGGTSWVYLDFFKELLGSGAAADVDFIGVHAYGSDPPEQAVDSFQKLRQLVGEHFETPPPVLDTEWGITSVGLGRDGADPVARARQAVLAVRSQLANWVAGILVSTWYDVRDGCSDVKDKHCNYGLLTVEGTDKPAMRAMRALADVARGRLLQSVLSDASGPHVLRLQGSDDKVLVVWLSDPSSQVTIRVPRPIVATDLYGATLTPETDDGQAISLKLSEASGPVYLHYAGRGPTLDGGRGSTGGLQTDGGRGRGGGSDGSVSDSRGSGDMDTTGCGCRLDGTLSGSPKLSPWLLVLGALWMNHRRRSACRRDGARSSGGVAAGT